MDNIEFEMYISNLAEHFLKNVLRTTLIYFKLLSIIFLYIISS